MPEANVGDRSPSLTTRSLSVASEDLGRITFTV